MAFAGLNLTIGKATSANGQGQLPHGAQFSQNMASAGTSSISAPNTQGGFWLFRVRSSADCFVAISKTSATTISTAAWFVAANTDYDFWGVGGDTLTWTLA